MMTSTFLSHAEIAHEITQVIGVFPSKDAAVARCRERTHAAKDLKGLESMPYDRHWVEEWELDGNYLRSFDVRGDEVIEHE